MDKNEHLPKSKNHSEDLQHSQKSFLKNSSDSRKNSKSLKQGDITHSELSYINKNISTISDDNLGHYEGSEIPSQLEVKDHLEVLTDPNKLKLLKEITSDSENKLYWSGNLIKINSYKVKQSRRFIIMSNSQINLGDENFKDSFISFFKGSQIRRTISLNKIKFITYSITSNEFILHISDERDYRFCSDESNLRDEFIYYMIKTMEDHNNFSKVFMFLREEIDLFQFAKGKSSKHDKQPNEVPKRFNSQKFLKWIHEKDGNLKEEISEQECFFNKLDKSHLTLEDFQVLKTQGKGAFGKVILCRKTESYEQFAIKIIEKMTIFDKSKFERLKEEKDILSENQHPFLASLEFCFQDKYKICFGMEFFQGGELYNQLKKNKRFPEKVVKFYAVQVQLGLIHLHERKIIYRDQKPENVMIGADGYLKIIDFGLSKMQDDMHDKSKTVAGTNEYLPPECVKRQPYTIAFDWWTFGVFMYEQSVGYSPFYDDNESKMYQKICEDDVKFPCFIEKKLTPEFIDLVEQQLRKDKTTRLGADEINQDSVKQHDWFKGVNFDAILSKKIVAPILPKIKTLTDLSNFSKDNIKEDPLDFTEDDEKLAHCNFDFEGFDFVKDKSERRSSNATDLLIADNVPD